MYESVLFDLDGTLTDPAEGITNSVAYSLRKFGINISDRIELYKFIGPPLVESFRDFYDFDEEQSLLAVEYYREYFSEIGIFENSVYDGIEDMLKELKANDVCIILATSKPEIFAERILKHFHLEGYFDVIAGSTLSTERNTKSAVIEYALKRACVTNKANAIMVGDRKHDIIGAKENGLHSVGVLFGYGNITELTNAGTDYIIETVNDLKTFLLKEI